MSKDVEKLSQLDVTRGVVGPTLIKPRYAPTTVIVVRIKARFLLEQQSTIASHSNLEGPRICM